MNPVSKQQQARWKRNAIWLLGLCVLTGFHFWLPPLNSGISSDSYSASATGKRAFFEIAKQRFAGRQVLRNRQPLVQFVEEHRYSDDILCLLGPSRSPTQREMDALYDWLRDGGSLIWALPMNARKDFEFEGVTAEPRDSIPFFDKDASTAESTLLESGKINWSTNVDFQTSRGETLVEQDGKPQALRLTESMFVIVASDYVFSNKAMFHGDNSVLAFRLLEATRGSGRIFFDESLNSSGTPKAVGLLTEPFLWPVTVQLMLLILLYAWRDSRRFGPALPPNMAEHQNIVAHTNTLGTLYFRTRNGKIPLKSYLAQFKTELRISQNKNLERVLTPIAIRMNVDVERLIRIIKHAEKVVEQARVDRGMAVRIIRRLALIREAAKQRTPTKSNLGDSDDE